MITPAGVTNGKAGMATYLTLVLACRIEWEREVIIFLINMYKIHGNMSIIIIKKGGGEKGV